LESSVPDLLLLNGPNLGRLGARRTDIYGTDTLADIEAMVSEEIGSRGWETVALQHDGEGELVRAIDEHRDAVAAIINPGALMIAGWSLRDALDDFHAPWIEVHLSNVWARESFRHVSVTAALASGVIAGIGPRGYRLAARALTELVDG
jgi:5-deoxy-5-amino-3-dehydroquinate dehydratase